MFRGKRGGMRVQGVLTPFGGQAFEKARKKLARLVKRTPDKVSDADVIEYLARGEFETKLMLGLD